ncbi:ketopantoate reductase family protein [Priestia megaterium]|uniref:ketopantoate reductase family protein n=1 Tax=Priestia megaterium TaxID=1404 RepID=UPI00277E413A|nr:ketopantoate reductase family protein [Priestia megaterium]MDQ0806261.1 2-dehydropantoate 2-reductase [Priestia megaterium]
MKICVLGAGALGSSIGGTLAEGGQDVYLINQRADHVNAINTKGLILRDGTNDRAVRVNAQTNCEGIGAVDLVIVLVKSFHTRNAIENASSIIGEDTLVMSLQNGLGNEETIAEVIGNDRVIGGKTYVGGVLLGPGHVIAGTKGKITFIGEMNGEKTKRIQRVADILTKCGLLTEVSSNTTGMIWDKLLINVATGALCGITKLPYGDLYQIPEIRDCAFEAILEGINVAKANGIILSMEDPEDIWLKAAAGLPYEFKTSMLQSLEKGQKTEIDYINGAIVRWGEKSNVATPVNKALVANVKGIETWVEKYINS